MLTRTLDPQPAPDRPPGGVPLRDLPRLGAIARVAAAAWAAARSTRAAAIAQKAGSDMNGPQNQAPLRFRGALAQPPAVARRADDDVAGNAGAGDQDDDSAGK